MTTEATLHRLIRTIPDYPKAGIMFRDVTTLLKDRQGFKDTLDAFAQQYAGTTIHKVAAIEARGFILGGALADRLGAGFVPIRKKGKLPSATIGHDYDLEYGTDRVEMHLDAIDRGERVLVVDDLIATGGTAEAAIRLVEQVGGHIVECAFVVDLPELGGRNRLENRGHKVFALCSYAGH